MKKFIVIALSVAMLMTSAAFPSSAAETCTHPSCNQTSGFWKSTGNGYNHTYVNGDGVTAVCGVTIQEYGYYEICSSCGAIVRFVGLGRTRDYHEIASHNTF